MLTLTILATIITALGLIAKTFYLLFMDNSGGSAVGQLLAIVVHFLTHGFTITVLWVLYANTGAV